MNACLQVYPIGRIRKDGTAVYIDIDPALRDGLLGLEGFSHIIVCYWFHENDNPDQRNVLRVHPRKDAANPLTGVFATHSPARPNLIGMTTCRVISITNTIIRIDEIDARDGSPVLDIKCYIPDKLDPSEITVPEWVLDP